MAIDPLDLGTTDNDGTGTPLKDGGEIINANFAELDARGLPLLSLEASEALTALHAVNWFGSGGALAQRKANATDTTKPCDGFVKANVAMGDLGDAYPLGVRITGFPAATFTPGDRIYLSTVGGSVTAVAPSAAGNGVQEVGVADTATSIVTYRSPMIGL